MKILHVTNAYPTDNLPSYGIFIKEQIESLNKLGIENQVFFINAKEQGKFRYIAKIPSLVKKIKNYQIIHAHHIYTGAIVMLLSLLNKKAKVIVSFLGSKDFDANNIFKRFLYRWIQKKSSAYILKDDPTFQKKDKKAYYLPNGVDLNMFYPMEKHQCKKKLGLNPEKKYILFCSAMSRFRDEKRYDIFKKVILHLKNWDQSIEELVMENIPRSQVQLYYNSAELHLLTSDFEGSPNSVKEALACQVPVVSTPVGNVPTMLYDISGSFVSETNEPSELCSLVIKAMQSPKGDCRKALKRKELTLDDVAKKLNVIYENIWG